MGVLCHFLLDKFIDRYGTRIFIETGTGGGEGLKYAATFPFDRLYSVEIFQKFYELAKKNFEGDNRVAIINAKSDQALDVLLQILPQDAPILFWLDAHFPGADYKQASYAEEKGVDIRLPLEREVEIISRHRLLKRDVIIIDDLRLYEDGDYAHGNTPELLGGAVPEKRGVAFVEKAFGESHFLNRDNSREGYLALIPRQTKG